MSSADFLKLGDWNAQCYECGHKFKASELKKHWQGYYVCPAHWEPRQAQDFVRSVPDVQTPPWTQPLPADTFSTSACFPSDQTAYPDTAIPGCVKPDYISPMYDPSIS